MTYSVIAAGGKQFLVSKGDQIDISINSKDINENDSLKFDILMMKNDEETIVGTPIIEDYKAICKVVALVKGPKGIAYKYKRRKGYSRTVGFRAKFIRVQVEDFKKTEVEL